MRVGSFSSMVVKEDSSGGSNLDAIVKGEEG